MFFFIQLESKIFLKILKFPQLLWAKKKTVFSTEQFFMKSLITLCKKIFLFVCAFFCYSNSNESPTTTNIADNKFLLLSFCSFFSFCFFSCFLFVHLPLNTMSHAFVISTWRYLGSFLLTRDHTWVREETSDYFLVLQIQIET